MSNVANTHIRVTLNFNTPGSETLFCIMINPVDMFSMSQSVDMSPPPVQPVLIKQIDLSELHRGLLSLRIPICQVLLSNNQSLDHIFCVTQSVDMSPPPVQSVLIKQIDLSELHRGLLGIGFGSDWIQIQTLFYCITGNPLNMFSMSQSVK